MNRFLQFRVITLLLLVTAVCVCLTIWRMYVTPYYNQAAALSALAPFDADIEFRTPKTSWIQYFVRSEDFVQVESIAISSEATFNDDQLYHLRQLIGLKALSLSDTYVTESGYGELGNLGSLEQLEVQDKAFNDIAMERICRIRPLKRLVLRDVSVTDEGLKTIHRLRNLEHLTAPQQTTQEGLNHIARLPALKTLDLSQTEIDAADMGVLQKLPLTSLPQTGDGAAFDDLEMITGFTQLENLHLKKYATDEDLARVATLKKLQTLRCYGDKITARGIQELAGLPDLTSLDVYASNIRQDELQVIAQKLRLKSLCVHSPHLLPAEVDPLFKSSTLREICVYSQWFDKPSMRDAMLKSGKLDSCAFDAAYTWEYNGKGEPISCTPWHGQWKVEELAQVARRATLESVTLNYPRLEDDMPARPFLPLTQLKHLNHLGIAGMPAPPEAWADIASMTGITLLSVESCNTGDQEMQFIAQLPELEYLVIKNSNVTGKGFSYLGQAKNLRSITIGSSHLTPQMFKVASKLPGLDAFYISHTTTSGDSPDKTFTFTEIPSGQPGDMPLLTNLGFHDVAVTDGCLKTIGQWKQLQSIYFSDSTFTQRGLAHLSELQHLTQVDFENCTIPADALRAFKAAHPGCHVSTWD